MLHAFCFGFWTQEVAVLRCTSGLWFWRVLSALAFPPLISSSFIPLHPMPASSLLLGTQRLSTDAARGAGLWHAVRTGKTGLGKGREKPAWSPGVAYVLGERQDAACES